jgi:gamma-glutamyl-gamma-aminobutyrate hydrolase PuuD
MPTPLIGLTAYAEDARWAVWSGKAAVVGWVYVDAIHRAGGRTLMIPPGDDGLERIVDVIDGLVLAGGQDINPARYGADHGPETQAPQDERDATEIALVDLARIRNMPVLAICRGLQIMNIARGGDLVQHLPDAVENDTHREVIGVFSHHPVEIAPGSLLGALMPAGLPVPSHHHQAADRIGDGLVPVAWAADGTIEALEDPATEFTLGVQWHPEEDPNDVLFDALVTAARRYRETASG